MAPKKQTYNEAFSQLQRILEEIESGKLDVDELAANVKKASTLIKFCKGKLYSTELEIEKILEDMEDNDS